MPPQGENSAKAQAQAKSVPDDSPILSASPLSPVVVQVDDKIYDAKTLAKSHAGGELFVKVFAGRDATEAFLSYHRKRFPHDRLQSLCLGSAQPMKTFKDDDYLELCKLVEEVLPRSKAFAPWHYWLKLVVLLGLAFGLELFIHTTKSYRWYFTGPLGLIFAWVGMNVQHDANHGSLSPVAAINRLFGLTQNWIGGSALDWIHQHDVQHHIYPNSVTTDPDIVGNDFLRLNPLKPLHRYQLGQHLYVFLLFALFGMSYIVSSVGHVVNGFHYTRMSVLVTKNRLFEEATIAFFVLRWIVFPLYQVPAISTLINVLPLFIVGGYYLAFFFIISHNFENAYFYRDDKDEAVKESFLRKQVCTAANVGGAWLAFINGGLNYQIEHHLFPRIQHSHYPTIAPIVRAYCEKKGIPYVHFPTVGENVASCVRHLHQLGSQQFPTNYHPSSQ
eukprot:gene6031-6641_t